MSVNIYEALEMTKKNFDIETEHFNNPKIDRDK